MDGLNGIYTGIVIDSKGIKSNGVYPDQFIGQVLVKITGVTPSRFNEDYKAIPSSNVDGSLDLNMAKQSEILAYVMQPITGESTQGVYNATTNSTEATRTCAAKQFTLMNTKLRGVFSDGPKKFLTPINNATDNNYFPNYPWNAGLGNYSIPEVNTRVVVGFLKGYRSFPIVLGKLPSKDEQEAFFTRGGVLPNAPNSAQNYT